MPTVLLVDDNPYVINFLSKCFTRGRLRELEKVARQAPNMW